MERRRKNRLGLELPGSYSKGDGDPRLIFVSELSHNGCRVSGDESGLAVGDRMTLSLGAVETVDATVKWADGPWLGVEFAGPLDDCIIEFFAAYCSKVA
jgi:hypothetical protein